MTYRLNRLARLQYLTTVVAAEEPGGKLLAPSSAVRMSEVEFDTRYPGYAGWLMDNAERLEREHPPLKLAKVAPTAAARGAHCISSEQQLNKRCRQKLVAQRGGE